MRTRLKHFAAHRTPSLSRGSRNARVTRLRRFGLLRLIWRWPKLDRRWRVAGALAAVYAAMILLPTAFAYTLHRGPLPPVMDPHAADARVSLRVYRKETGSVVTVSLRDYVISVLAAEMPPTAPAGALEAAAVAIRTYAIHTKTAGPSSQEARSHGADLTDDPGLDLPWLPAAQRDQRYGSSAPVYEARLAQAVQATDGIILIYGGAPINAFTCALSPGRTRDASTVFGRRLPYLPSVPCPDDAKAPDLVRTETFTRDEIASALGLDDAVNPRSFQVAGRDAWNFVLTVTDGKHRWTGEEFAAKLHLPTACFTIAAADSGTLTVRTTGEGNGLGMSLHEAQAMAQRGTAWASILSTFYPGAKLESVTAILQVQ
ncbi:MAG: SpoIID/LytB domain-containing protein [Thermoflavifilum sp.]|nr:SpoIID/LytB domain-containing protein [Thermoflavifilum sp.]MCL6513211.1 SpoIID/LytB domain-containing protein [Alicyclobacillus sp.]